MDHRNSERNSAIRSILSGRWWVLALCCFIAGCDSGRPMTAPVFGTLTLDGNPIAGAVVTFVPVAGGRPAQGESDAEGRFKLSTFGADASDGAAIGEHRVSVTKVQPSNDRNQRRPYDPPDPNDRRPQIVWLVPQRFSNTSTSGLSSTVVSGTNEVRFDLKSHP